MIPCHVLLDVTHGKHWYASNRIDQFGDADYVLMSDTNSKRGGAPAMTPFFLPSAGFACVTGASWG
jgi:hypothetical protein